MAARDIEAGRAHVIIRLRDMVTGGLQKVERSVAGFGRNFATLGAAMTAGGAGALAFPLKMAADMEQMGIALEVLLGNADSAKAMLKGLSDFAKKTPFSLVDVGENAKMLLAYGIAGQNVLPNLRALGDVALGDKEKFGRLTLAFGQTQAKGRLMGQEVLQMTEAGFNPLQEISRTTGKSVATLSKEMEAGSISAAMLTRAFQTATGPGGRFHNGMERMSSSAYGLMGKLMDAVAFGLKPIGDAAIAVLKPVVTFATDVASAFQAFAEKNQWLTKAIAGTLIALVAVGAVLTGIGLGAIALSTVLGTLATAVSFAVAVLGFVFSPIGLAIGSLLALLVTFRSQIASAFSAAANFLKPFASALLRIGLGLIALITIIGGVATVLSFVFSPIGLAIGSLLVLLVTFRSQIASAFSAVASFVKPFTDALYEIGSIFKQTIDGIVGVLMNGDLGAAADIAWLGVVAAAWQGVAELGNAITAALDFLQAWIPGVDAVRNYVQQAFAGVGQAILAGRWDLAGAIMMAKLGLVVHNAWTSISEGWSAFTIVLMNTFDSMGLALRSTWRTVTYAIASGILTAANFIYGVFDRIGTEISKLAIRWGALWSEDAAAQAPAAIAKLEQDFQKRAQERSGGSAAKQLAAMKAAEDAADANATQSRQNKRYDAGAAQMSQNQARAKQMRDEIATLQTEAGNAYAAAGAPTVEDAAKKARDELQAAIKLATEQGEQPEIKGLKGLKQQAGGAVEQLGKVGSMGTFSASGAAASLGFDGRPMQDTAKNTKRLVQLAERPQAGGVKFAGG